MKRLLLSLLTLGFAAAGNPAPLSPAVRVEMDARGGVPEGLDDARRRSQRVLVGGQARDLRESEFGRQRFEGAPRVVGGEAGEYVPPEVSHPRIV